MTKAATLAAAGLIALHAALPPPPLPPPHAPPPRPVIRHVSSRSRHPLTIPFLVTAYCPCRACCGKTDGITASGRRAMAGHTVAVDPSYIPLGARLLIQGLGERVAEDIGGAIRGRHLDVFFPTHAEAVAFGRRWMQVRLIPAGEE